MLTTLQIVLLSIIGASAIASLVFMIMFIVEITVEHKEKEEEEVSSVYSNETYITINNETNEKEASVDEMLAKLEDETKDEETVEEKPTEIVEARIVEEVKEEEKPAVTNIIINNFAETKKEEKIEDLASLDESDTEDDDASDDDIELLSDISELKSDNHTVIATGSVIDYKTRLDKIIETRNKIEKDLAKIQKSILKYERTKRRKNRNQKMLDRRAGELTNLNLVMYSVTDIKNVDEDKKVKQEELTAHIAELKASIQDADEFIESNKEKNDHNVKMAKFLLQEKARYNEEIAELQELINKTDDTSAIA